MLLFFLYFAIGHLIGDFLLQSSSLVLWKYRSALGITVHVLLVFFGTALMFFPYKDSSLIWTALILNAIVHWGIDFLKVNYDLTAKPKNPLPGFYLDQIAHVATFTIIVCWLYQFNIAPHFFTDTWWFEYYTNINLLIGITGFLFFSYSFDIILFMYRLKRGDKNPYRRAYFSMIVRTFLFSLSFGILWLLYTIFL